MDSSLRWDSAEDRANILHLLGMAEYLSLRAVVLPPPTSSNTPNHHYHSHHLAALDIASLIVEFSGDHDSGRHMNNTNSDVVDPHPWRASLEALIHHSDEEGVAVPHQQHQHGGGGGEWGGGCALSSTHLWLPCTPSSSSTTNNHHYEILSYVRGLLGQDPSSLPTSTSSSASQPSSSS